MALLSEMAMVAVVQCRHHLADGLQNASHTGSIACSGFAV
jgi:hypothetical protein